MIRLSQTSKLGCRSWSLVAVDTCPGARADDGGLVEACRGCYATAGNYRYPNVKAPREHNRTDWEREAWVSDMVAELQNDRFFRWFDSGDAYALGLLEKIEAVIAATPKCSHWLPTRMHKFPKFRAVIDRIMLLPNVAIRASLDEVFTDRFDVAGRPGLLSGIIASPEVPTDAKVCRAYDNGGKCGSCRACWDRTVKAIAYPAHGRSMAKVIRLKTV